ncbi:MAG: glycosyltransferase family 2 protein [Cyanophyceae cyanobacterium]
MMPKYSLIVPIYNEVENLPELYQRVVALMDRLDGPAELILVNDGSRDRSLELIRSLRDRDGRVCYVSFARNFGHQTAVTAGLHFARGQAIAILDADLQDPPELILDMVHLWQQNYQVIYAQRIARRQENWFKRLMAYCFYRILRRLSDIDMPTDAGDFCLLDRRVVDALNAMPERSRYLRGLRSWVGFRQIALPFSRDPRFAGEVKYTFLKSLSLAIDGIISFSKVPLRLATYLGLFAALVALASILLVFYWRFLEPSSPLTGMATLTALVFFLGAVQLVCIGILGEYVGRIYEEVKGRPIYTLAEVAGFEEVMPPDRR